MAQAIKMLFEMQTQVGPTNLVLNQGPCRPREGHFLGDDVVMHASDQRFDWEFPTDWLRVSYTACCQITLAVVSGLA